MPSTYTTNLGIELPADGELDGVWGDVVNENMEILDRAINGSVTLTLSGTTSTLTTSDGALSNGQYKLLVLGGTPSGTHTITIAPSDAQKIYFVRNTTAQSVVFTQGSGGNVTVATGDSAIIYSDGAGAGAAVVNITNDFAMSSVKITGGTIDGTVIGGTSAAAGTFTTVTSGLGAVGTPSITFTGDTNTGIWSPAADTIAFSEGGVESMRIDSAGNVGIGVVPSAWSSLRDTLQVGTGGFFSASTNATFMELGTNNYVDTGSAYRYLTTGTAANYRQFGGVHSWFNAASGTAGDVATFTERMRITSAGNLLLGTTTDFTSTTTAGGMALTGYGIYPYTTQTGATNSTVLSSLTALPAVAATGSAGITLAGGQFSPALSNDGTGGSSAVGALGINSVPVITSSGSTALVSLTAVQGTANRGNASDTSANASNFIISGNFSATHGTGLPTTAVSGTVYGLSGNIVNGSGTMTAATAVRAQVNLGSTSTFKTNSTPTAAGFELGAFAVGAATAVGNATVTNGYGIKLVGPNVGVTGTMTNYYAFRADAPTVTGTLTNRYGIWMDDSLATNYFSGKMGIGTTTPNSGPNAGFVSIQTPQNFGLSVFRNSTDPAQVAFVDTTNSAAIGTNGAGSLVFFNAPRTTERMRIDSSGNVGIGTTTPGAELHVNNASASQGRRGIRLSASGWTAVYGELVVDTSAVKVDLNTSNTAYPLSFSVGNTERMRIDSSGNVGIGTSSPAAKLDVTGEISSTGRHLTAQGVATSGYQFVGDGDSGMYQEASNQLQFSTANAERMRITSAGNVGIGTNAPIEKLDVRGAIFVGNVASGINYDGMILDYNTSTREARLAVGATSGGNSFFTFTTSNGGVEGERMRITSAGNVGISTTAPSGALDVSSGLYAIVMGADSGATVRTDVTNKLGRFGGYHYTNAEEPVCLILSSAEATNNVVSVGGGTSNMNTATQLRFFTAANSTTLTGSERMRIDSSGNVGIGTSSPSQLLHVQSTSGAAGSAVLRLAASGSTSLQVGQEFFSTTTTNVTALRSGRIYSAFDGTAYTDARLSFQSMTSGDVLVDTMHLKGGNVGIGTSSPTNPLDVNADSVRIRTAQTPATSGAAGNQGEIAWDANYIYVCTATNTWKRVAIATW